MKTIGVVGAGVMGSGVSQNLAQVGYKVILVDISKEILERSNAEIYNKVRLQTFFQKDHDVVIDPGSITAQIRFTTDYQQLKEAEYVIESVPEKWDIKENVYREIDSICNPECIFAANTSCFPITRIASLTKRPSKIIGTHYMNPVPMKTTVETIRGYFTSDETIEITKKLLASMGKECIVVNDYPGFVSNRISHLFMNEAAFVVQDQVASPQEVDDIFKKCYSHKMGPLDTADLIGLDTVVNSLDVLYESYQDPKFRCCPLLKKMVDAGLYGMKSGQGFYVY
jgi:3-hydroxybutyryl-CoA dehydrogenase